MFRVNLCTSLDDSPIKHRVKETAATAIHNDAVYRGKRRLNFFERYNIRVLSIRLIAAFVVLYSKFVHSSSLNFTKIRSHIHVIMILKHEIYKISNIYNYN